MIIYFYFIGYEDVMGVGNCNRARSSPYLNVDYNFTTIIKLDATY